MGLAVQSTLDTGFEQNTVRAATSEMLLAGAAAKTLCDKGHYHTLIGTHKK
jgi:hypothetical protein